MPDSTRRSAPIDRTIQDADLGLPDRHLRRGEGAHPPFTMPAMPADEVAMMALRIRHEDAAAAEPKHCDACDAPIVGEAAGSGLYVWPGDGEARIEEPPLCEACATAIGVVAIRTWSEDDGEEG